LPFGAEKCFGKGMVGAMRLVASNITGGKNS
jgi:hypothetical protein